MHYYGGIYFITGDDGTLRVSQDGDHWENLDLEVHNNYNDMSYDGEQFILVGNKGVIFRSMDGYNWTQLDQQEGIHFLS